MEKLRAFFATPARQALAWTALGIVGILFASVGVWFLTGDGGGGGPVEARPEGAATPTATVAQPTATPSRPPSRTATARPSPSPSPTATQRPSGAPAAERFEEGAAGGGPEPGPPPPTPTTEPIVAGGDFCPPASVGPGSLPSARVAGAVRRGGVPVPAGEVQLVLAFDGVGGPSTTNTEGAFKFDFYAAGEGCANRVGAAISVIADGQVFATGHTIGDGAQLIPVDIALP